MFCLISWVFMMFFLCNTFLGKCVIFPCFPYGGSWCFLFFVFVMTGDWTWGLYMLIKASITEVHPQPKASVCVMLRVLSFLLQDNKYIHSYVLQVFFRHYSWWLYFHNLIFVLPVNLLWYKEWHRDLAFFPFYFLANYLKIIY